MIEYSNLIETAAPFKPDLEHIEADCQSGNFEDAALRVKKIAANFKSTSLDEGEARNYFIAAMNVIDEHLQGVLEDWQFASYRLALTKVKTARFVLNDLRLH